jgi:O-succinylbenzoate synthase
MIKFWTSKYELVPFGNLGSTADAKPRAGALFKAQWPNGNIGYADIFPWPELGDAPIDEQIAVLGRGQLSPLVEQSIWLAKKDAVLRKAGKNAFANIAKIKNHYLVNDFTKFTEANMKDLRSAGFSTLKIKVGRSVDEEGKFIAKIIRQNPITVRLDFNAKVGFAEFERLFSHLGVAEKPRIEFVEDPVPWNLEAWTEAAKLAPIALDQEYHKVEWEKLKTKPPFSTVVLKPARQDVDHALNWINKFALKMVVSSSMDHPIGVAHACSVAAELKKFYPNTLLDCGCLSLKVYRPNEFSSRIQLTGPYLKDIPGTGIGFDDLLEKVTWVPVQP